MRVFLEVVGVLAVIQGVGAAISESGWFVINLLPVLDGHELFAGIAVAVLGTATCLAAASQSSRNVQKKERR
ncbi:hypothetical protein [Nonomuraea soli]|uniref:Uncharacterized protein n=1 Tax=Nonomuraea soli TaxID=1032476 RepID=A0A7W0CE72_9ACTN|nr:hypothetical protein [Nonomuraea soli]MBA2889489.1 hypothetical protein [Nonomuraea soli]